MAAKAFVCILQYAHSPVIIFQSSKLGYIKLPFSISLPLQFGLLTSYLVNAAGLFRWWNRAGSHTWEDRWHTLTHDWPRGPRCTFRALSGGQVGADLLQKFWWDWRGRQLTMWGDWKYETNNFSIIQKSCGGKALKDILYLDPSSVKSDY